MHTLLVALCLTLGALASRADLTIHPSAAPLPFTHQGPFIRAHDGALWTMDATGALVSPDEGLTWNHRPLLDPTRFQARKERALLRTREGVMLYAFLNEREKNFLWDDQKGGPQEGCRLPVYLLRSDDDGVTWEAPRLLQDGWCGAVRQMIQLKMGRIILVSQRAEANPARHVTLIHVSDDLGRTWKTSSAIDLGEQGNYSGHVGGLSATTHGGGIEGTVFEKDNGDLKLFLRVPHGHFAELTSKDGLTWSAIQPSPIEASDSPGMVARLASGRIVLVWNRFVEPTTRSGRREELSIALSRNDGVTWTQPQVIAVNRVPPKAREGHFWISYPYVFEPAPGRLWITTMQGPVRMAVNEGDYLSPNPPPLDGPAVRILTLGDSITRAARPGVRPTESFSAQIQTALRARGIKVNVHNLGIGGERTDGALARLQDDVLSQRPHGVVLMYGTNDSWVDTGKTASRLNEEVYEKNLRILVKQLNQAGIKVVLMTPPRFAEENRRNGLNEDPNDRLARFAERCRAVAREEGVPLVDHFAHWQAEQTDGRRLQAWTTDGCHPNAAGHAVLAEKLLPALLTLTDGLRP